MKPYYEDTKSGIIIYHGDCREILPTLPSVDLVLTDPPFGIGNFVQTTGNVRGNKVEWNNEPPDDHVFQTLRGISKHRIIWGAEHFNCFEGHGALVWDKEQPMEDFSKVEIASKSFGKKTELFKYRWTNYVNTKETDHPCERPLSLYLWCIQLVPDSPITILDPYIGSGTVLRAAKDLGKKAIGIDKDEHWCEVSANRLSQEVLPL